MVSMIVFHIFVLFQGGKKLERARDLFEQAVDGCPAKFAKCEDPPLYYPRHMQACNSFRLLFLCVALYLLYAKLEEEHGLSRHAMAIYDRATKAVPAEEQLEVYTVYMQVHLRVGI